MIDGWVCERLIDVSHAMVIECSCLLLLVQVLRYLYKPNAIVFAILSPLGKSDSFSTYYRR